MSKIYDVSHKTLYRYSAHVVQSQHVVHMSPRMMRNQNIRLHSLIVEPAPVHRYEGIDAFGNQLAILDIEIPHKELVLHSRSTIEVIPPAPFNRSATCPWDRLDEHLTLPGGDLDLDTIQYRCVSRYTPASPDIADYAAPSFPAGRPVLEAAMDLTLRIFKEFKFDGTATDISTPIVQVVRQRRGVCQDFAHVALACLRTRRIPARYVSGYILTHPAPGQVKLQGADASHAWISVWSPEAGWVDFDPTNGIAITDEHIAISYGRDYNDVSPISGILLGGGAHSVSVGVDVTPIG